MDKISLSVAAYELKIDRRTLNKFLDELGIVAEPVEYDARIHGISKADLERVRDHLFERLRRSVENRDELRQELEEVKARLRVLEQMQMRPFSLPGDVSGAVASVKPSEAAYRPSSMIQNGRGLPPGYAAVSTFCKDHNIPASTVKAAIDRGELFCHDGTWHVGRSIVQHAFDEQQQAAVLERYGGM